MFATHLLLPLHLRSRLLHLPSLLRFHRLPRYFPPLALHELRRRVGLVVLRVGDQFVVFRFLPVALLLLARDGCVVLRSHVEVKGQDV